MDDLPRSLGSITSWAIIRIGEGFLLVVAVVLLVRQENFGRPAKVVTVLLLAGLLAYFHPFGFGFADEKGITFCRYFKLCHVPWAGIDSVHYRRRNPYELVVVLKEPAGWARTVKFPVNLSDGELEKFFQGESAPQVEPWITERLWAPEAQTPNPEARRDGQ